MQPLLKELQAVLREEVSTPLQPSVAAIAEAARRRHEPGIAAVLVYGSALREGENESKIVDLYLLSNNYRDSHQSWPMRGLNRLLPPNVYFLETSFEKRKVRSKYAIVSLPHFERLVTSRTFHPYFWARFAQPTALAWVADQETANRVIAALAASVTTMLKETAPLLNGRIESRELWVRAFAETYRTELRAERQGRGIQLYETYERRYQRITDLVASTPAMGIGHASVSGRRRASRRWRRRRIWGKALSVLRLLKGAFTFRDGAAYLRSKIEQHSGVPIELSPWQQRHPILASPVLFFHLYRKGAFR